MSTKASYARIRAVSDSFHGLIFSSLEMQSLIARLRAIATTNEVVLVLGESGTGKDLVARAIHEESSRQRRPFVPFNCSTLSRDLVESRLFGYRKGAFTGASVDGQGIIAGAAGGTLFLDEIGDLNFDVQGALLRFLDRGEIQPVGAPRPVIADVRVIAATNRDLTEEVAAGRFRKDLYYRLNVATLLAPPLRSRPEDVKELARHFARVYSVEYGKAEPSFTEEEMKRLVAHEWPGNVRELENRIKRLILFGDLGIQKNGSYSGEPKQVWASLSELEKRARVWDCLESNGWNVTLTANHLGICRRTVQRYKKKLESSPDVPADLTSDF